MFDSSSLLFVEDVYSFNIQKDDIAVWIVLNIGDKQKLFDLLARNLHFPSYFGRNWDALNDLFSDFEWIPQRRIFVLHEDLPLERESKDRKIYLEILIDTISYWQKEEEHEFVAVFPITYRDKIDQILDVV